MNALSMCIVKLFHEKTVTVLSKFICLETGFYYDKVQFYLKKPNKGFQPEPVYHYLISSRVVEFGCTI